MTDEELIDYYIDLLEIQYHDRPNARAEMAVWVKAALSDQIVQKVMDAFNLNLNISNLTFDLYPIDDEGNYVEWGLASITAEGKQLDTIAKYVGVSRIINGLDLSKLYFQIIDYDEVAPDSCVGYASYTDDPGPTAYYMSYRDVINSLSISDTDLRLLMLLKIQLNKYDGTLKGADDICSAFFGGAVNLIDNEDMTITYEFDSDQVTDFIRIVIFMRMLPRPAGISVIIIGGSNV